MNPIVETLRKLASKRPAYSKLLNYINDEGFATQGFFEEQRLIDDSYIKRAIPFRIVFGGSKIFSAGSPIEHFRAQFFHNAIQYWFYHHDWMFHLKDNPSWKPVKETVPKSIVQQFKEVGFRSNSLVFIKKLCVFAKSSGFWSDVPESTKEIVEDFLHQFVLSESEVVDFLNGKSWIHTQYQHLFFDPSVFGEYENAGLAIALLYKADHRKGKIQNRLPGALLSWLGIQRSIPLMAALFDIISLYRLGLLSIDEPSSNLDQFIIGVANSAVQKRFKGFFLLPGDNCKSLYEDLSGMSLRSSLFLFNAMAMFSAEERGSDFALFMPYYNKLDKSLMSSYCLKLINQSHFNYGSVSQLLISSDTEPLTARSLYNTMTLVMLNEEEGILSSELPFQARSLLKSLFGEIESTGVKTTKGKPSFRKQSERTPYELSAIAELKKGVTVVQIAAPWEKLNPNTLYAMPNSILNVFTDRSKYCIFGYGDFELKAEEPIFCVEYAQTRIGPSFKVVKLSQSPTMAF